MNALRCLLSLFIAMSFGLGCGAVPTPQEPAEELGPPRESLLSALPASPRSTLAAFSTTTRLRTYYLDPVSTVSELAAYGLDWTYSYLPGSAAPGSPLTGFQVGSDLPRVYYVSNDRHVHELWWDGTWHDNDLTSLTNAPIAAADSPLIGVTLGGSWCVYYVESLSRDIYELRWNGSGWSAQDVSALAMAPPADTGSPLTGFAVNGSYARVYFVGTNRHVYELWSSGGSVWAHQDLSHLTNAPMVDNDTALTGFAVGGIWSRVYYVGDYNRHVIELKFTPQGWVSSNVTPAGAPYTTAQATALTGFAVNPGDPRVYFLLDTNNVGELWWDGASWHLNNLTSLASAPAAKAHSPLASFAINGMYSRVYYLASNDNVMQLAWSGATWSSRNLTATAN